VKTSECVPDVSKARATQKQQRAARQLLLDASGQVADTMAIKQRKAGRTTGVGTEQTETAGKKTSGKSGGWSPATLMMVVVGLNLTLVATSLARRLDVLIM
jgi:hypothetical protein